MAKSAQLGLILSLERMKIGSYFVANLRKLIVQNKVHEWLNISVVRSETRLVTGDVLENYVKQPLKRNEMVMIWSDCLLSPLRAIVASHVISRHLMDTQLKHEPISWYWIQLVIKLSTKRVKCFENRNLLHHTSMRKYLLLKKQPSVRSAQ